MNFCIIEDHNENTNITNHHCVYIKNLNGFLSIDKANKKVYPCETCT